VIESSVKNGLALPLCGALTFAPSTLAPCAPLLALLQLNFVLLISRQGKTRLTKWYEEFTGKEKARAIREVTAMVLSRPAKQCNFIEYKDRKIVYKRWCLSARVLYRCSCSHMIRFGWQIRKFVFCHLRRQG
jgi:hypothetical protein